MPAHSQGTASRLNIATMFPLAGSMPASPNVERPTGSFRRPCDDMPHFADQPGL